MAVEGKTILQTTERTELTGKEGIPFQEGMQNGHVLVERLKEYVGEGLVKEDGLKTINGEKLTGIGDITIESDTGKPVILRYPKYNETSDDSTMLEKANSGEWFCTLPQMLENYNDGNLKAPFIGVQDDTNENFSPVTCYRVYSASNYYFMLYFLESNNNMEIQFRGFRMKYDPQDLTKWTGVFDNGTVRLSLASASNDGLRSKEDKAKVDGIQFNTNENSILFGGKRYVAFHLKRVENLTESSTSEDIASVIGEATEDNFSSITLFISRGGLFIVQDNWREYAAVANYNSVGEVRYVQFEYIAKVSNKIVNKRIMFGFDGSAWSFKTFLTEIAPVADSLSSSSVTHALSAAMGKKLQNEKLAKEDVVDNLDSSSSTLVLSANQGRILNRKMFTFSGTIHEGMTAFEENFYEIDEAIDEGALFTGVVEYGGESYKIVLASYRSENVPPFVSYKFVSSVFGNGIYCVVTATKNANQGGQLGDFTVEMVELPTKQVVSGFQSEISALKEEIEALKGSGA